MCEILAVRGSIALFAATVGLVVTPLPALAAAPLPTAARVLTERMQREADQLGRRLADERRDVVRASERHDRVLAAHERAAASTRTLRGLARTPGMPALAAEVLLAEGGPLVRAVAQAKRAEQDAARHVERATEAAARTQSRLLDVRRRAEAFDTALAGARRDPSKFRAPVTYRFGGEGTAPVSAGAIDDYLESKASPMAGEGASFVESGVRWRVDPRLLVAIAGAESYFGLKTCAPHNAWGWGCPNSPFAFPAWGVGIDVVARGLRERYLDDGLGTVGTIHLRYAPPAAANDPTGLNYAWADNVAGFLLEQGGNPQKLDGSGPRGRPITGVH